MIDYQLEPHLTSAEFIDVLRRSTLAERRPVDDAACIAKMLQHASVGVARAITDFGYCTYLSDLAVDEQFQRQGIGKELIRRTHEAAGVQTNLVLLAAPKARDYYPHIGMRPHDSCWIISGARPSTPAAAPGM
jgi:GNAT superfamily N-acetyltransferase